MSRKLILSLIFDWGAGKPVNLFIKNTEPWMLKFTNKWYLFHRDGKFVLKNLEEWRIIEMSDNFNDPISTDAVQAIIDLLNTEMGYSLEDITVNKNIPLTQAPIRQNLTPVQTVAPTPVQTPSVPQVPVTPVVAPVPTPVIEPVQTPAPVVESKPTDTTRETPTNVAPSVVEPEEIDPMSSEELNSMLDDIENAEWKILEQEVVDEHSVAQTPSIPPQWQTQKSWKKRR